jgi:hypothetical protein
MRIVLPLLLLWAACDRSNPSAPPALGATAHLTTEAESLSAKTARWLSRLDSVCLLSSQVHDGLAAENARTSAELIAQATAYQAGQITLAQRRQQGMDSVRAYRGRVAPIVQSVTGSAVCNEAMFALVNGSDYTR